ncbi:L-aspartate oxidase [Thermosporothrix hazakensis]|uniref:L-aspartate oxidase n=2 Tax=Thermosporothrix TaxID=768650 RepID=A0A326TZN6_THEHA|nr:L-aspartate oxidase [Thermosporothrix hazakensis]PZW22397.1 L-aspartate oxidase [Thermosporothrix hazakensis]BBH91099.1 L-aspartate oxidase [Thermosporothrix sp. COM3]GCE49151.1 L-aspartate oxidase [Thermosporothrix hazakensis]
MRTQKNQPFDVVIIGGGIAGLSLALRLPETVRVALLTKGKAGESNTRYAQGGIAVALGEDDTPELHLQDTLAAGAGLCDEAAVRTLVEQGPAAVRWLIQMGVQFDKAQPGDLHVTADGLLLGREGAHCRWRVLHAGGDATGAEIERALLVALHERTSIVVYEETYVSELLMQAGICTGIRALDRAGNSFTLSSRFTVLASGGAGGLWLHTSNPGGATSDGIALAWRAGAALTDLEFMQFHPTVMAIQGASHLISEAVRGEGAYLRNHAGERFMLRYSQQAELAPRDVVARAILKEMVIEEVAHQYLDLRHLPAQKMHARFPTISTICSHYGLDLAQDLIPVAPAAHYCMGGVMVDTVGRTTVPGLYAVGEVACTGVHGANRLASNSLLEGLVFGIQAACHLVEQLKAGTCLPAPEAYSLRDSAQMIEYEEDIPASGEEALSISQIRQALRQTMWRSVSLSRDAEGLTAALQQVRSLKASLPEQRSREEQETANMLQVAELVIVAALTRWESRGSHWRSDFPTTDERLKQRHFAFQRRLSGSSDQENRESASLLIR